MRRAEKKKNVFIVGGGVAGMETARVAALRGHSVILYEKRHRLGGHLVEASVPAFKEDMRRLIQWFLSQLEQHNVVIEYGKEVTAELVKKIQPDALILAIGSKAISPDVPGITKPNVRTAVDVLLDGEKADEIDVVVVGGGFVGCETALYLDETRCARRVTIVEILDDVGTDMELISRQALLERLDKSGVKVLTGMKLERIVDNGVVCIDKGGERHSIKADEVVLALGFRPRNDLVKEVEHLAPEVFQIGDCLSVGRIRHAVADGWRVANTI